MTVLYEDEGLVIRATTKRCNACLEHVPLDAFHKNSFRDDGLQATCKACVKARYTKTGWRRHLERTYGITVEQYDDLVKRQNGRCAICERTPQETGRRRNGATRLCVDHDHNTGVVRGLLCLDCNTAVGLMNDDPQRLQAAIDYLRGGSRFVLEPSTFETVTVMR